MINGEVEGGVSMTEDRVKPMDAYRDYNKSFEEKIEIFSHDYLKYCLFISRVNAPRYIFNKKLYSEMISASQLLEDFLDVHGAKNNKDWYLYRELSAAVRHLSLASYSQKHILNRLSFYNLLDSEPFGIEGEATLDFLTQTLIKLSPVIINEARRLNIHIPSNGFDPADFPCIQSSRPLPYDINDECTEEQRKNIVKIATDFLEITNHFDPVTFYEPYNFEQLKKIVPERINEVEIRKFEMQVHNLQSYFDSYVLYGGFNGKSKLKEFRSVFSVVFHLLNVMGRLLHFYERHLHEAGFKNAYKLVRNRLCELIDPHRLLDRTINYGLYYVCFFLSNGKSLAQEILNENIEKTQIVAKIPEGHGLHCRPSLLIARIVQHYGTQVDMLIGKDRFDAGSVLDLQWAGGKIQKENITKVVFEGDIRALKDIQLLASYNYFEDMMGKGIAFPKELHYLK